MMVTIEKLVNRDIGFWEEKAKTFRPNLVAYIVGLEENHKKAKGLHVHMLLQYSTKQDLGRGQFLKHFESEAVNVRAPGKGKQNILNLMSYVSKTGNIKKYGDFIYRGSVLTSDPVELYFQTQVKSTSDAIAFFQKKIKESINSRNGVIEETVLKENAIGRYLLARPALRKELEKVEHAWRFSYQNSLKKGFEFEKFVYDKDALEKKYKEYLREFEPIFYANLEEDSGITLEDDFDSEAYVTHDLENLRCIRKHLDKAKELKWERPRKSVNLFIWSEAPSFGKTRLLHFLKDTLPSYRLPDDQYYTAYKNYEYAVVVSDEARAFLSSKKMSHLKTLLEGEPVEFNRKGKTKIIKADNPLVVLMENKSLESIMDDHFHSAYLPLVMRSRILDLEIKSRATLHFFVDRCMRKL